MPFAEAAEQAIQNFENDQNSESVESTGTSENQSQIGAQEQEPQSEAQAIQEILDLEKLAKGKFKFDGQEMTLDDLKRDRLRYQDYTKKTQALAEERKFIDNLDADLSAVRKDPNLIAKFKQIYPEKFHRYLAFVQAGAQSPGSQGQESQGQTQNLPPEVLEKLKKLDELESKVSGFEAESIEGQKQTLDNIFSTLETDFKKKYPRADMIHVYGAVSDYLEANGLKSKDLIQNKTATSKMFEQFTKASHEARQKEFEEWKKAEVEVIRENNSKASDIGRGGGTPSGAPKKYGRKMFDEVADEMVSDFQHQ